MTPARKAALQWFHDRREVDNLQILGGLWDGHLTPRLLKLMEAEGHIECRPISTGMLHSLTDKGRRDLHEAGR